MDTETLHILGFQTTAWVVNIVGFLILLAMLRAWLWGPLMRTIDSRAERIARQLREAEQKLAEANRQRQQADEYLAQQKAEAERVSEQIIRQAQQEADELRRQAREQANEIRRQAKENALQMKAEALEEAKNQLAELAAAMAQRLLVNVLDEDRQRAILDAAVRDIEQIVRREELN